MAVSFIGGYPEKTTDLSQGTVKFYYIMFYQVHLTMRLVRTHTFSGNLLKQRKSP
jgi:hypothetical protein